MVVSWRRLSVVWLTLTSHLTLASRYLFYNCEVIGGLGSKLGMTASAVQLRSQARVLQRSCSLAPDCPTHLASRY